jgi:glyoxylase-like metal-dependent hydrolase (beta-lactamase superfamily II)
VNELDRAVAKLGVHRIPVPVPFLHAGGPANAYLVEEEGGGLLMVDTGLSTGDGAAGLDAGFQRLGFHYRDVRRIVVTHGHVDHFGGARHVQERAGREVPVLVHPIDAPKVAEGGWGFREHAGAYARHLARLGVPPELGAKVMELAAPAFEIARHVPATRPLAEGATLRGRHVELRVIHAPGHTPGLVVLHDAEHRLLLSGDHLLEHISPNPLLDLGPDDRPGWFRPLVAYERSIRDVRALELEAVLPGHGPPFGDHRRVIDSLLAFQRRRQERLRALLAAGPRTPWELARELFPKSGIGDLFLVVSETVANLEALEERGEAALLAEAEPWRYAAGPSTGARG